MKKWSYLNYLTVVVLVVLFNQIVQGQNSKEASLTRLKANVEFLASDELEGRATGSSGEKIAAQFIASELKKYGVKPFGDNASYFQDFPIASMVLDSTSELYLTTKGEKKITKETLKIDRDFAIWSEFLPGNLDTSQQAIIFVGYGITAKEFNYDDYSGIDVKGKYVAFLNGEPESDDPNYFDGPKPTKHSNLLSKLMLAAQCGASGIIRIVPERLMANADRIKIYSFLERLTFPHDFHVQEDPFLPPVVYLFPDGAKKLFADEIKNYENLQSKENKSKPEKFALKKTISLGFKRNVNTLSSKNVIGIIEGTDPNLKNQYVTISAHYDHLGIVRGHIYNGADDNASGTVAVLEAIKNLAMKKKNSRSIVVIFYSGEEKGLLGSTYYVKTVKNKNDLIVNLNVDMCGRESADTLFVVGPDITSKDFNALINKKNNDVTKFYLDYSNSNYEMIKRTDLAPFYKYRVPAVTFEDEMKIDYHMHTDDADRINYEKIYKTAKLVESIASEITNSSKRFSFTQAK